MNVTAKDKGSGKEQSITIQNSGNLDKDEVEKARKDAEAHAEEDKKKREAIESRNILENAVYQAEKLSSDNKEKLSEDDQKVLKDAIEAAKKVIGDETADKDALEAANKELSDKMMPIGAKLYEQATDTETPENSTESTTEEPIEGEVVDDKDQPTKD